MTRTEVRTGIDSGRVPIAVFGTNVQVLFLLKLQRFLRFETYPFMGVFISFGLSQKGRDKVIPQRQVDKCAVVLLCSKGGVRPEPGPGAGELSQHKQLDKDKRPGRLRPRAEGRVDLDLPSSTLLPPEDRGSEDVASPRSEDLRRT